jgi:hypothetical protein
MIKTCLLVYGGFTQIRYTSHSCICYISLQTTQTYYKRDYIYNVPILVEIWWSTKAYVLVHMVENVCVPKTQGGMSFRDLYCQLGYASKVHPPLEIFLTINWRNKALIMAMFMAWHSNFQTRPCVDNRWWFSNQHMGQTLDLKHPKKEICEKRVNIMYTKVPEIIDR